MPLRRPKVRGDLEYYDQELEGDEVVVIRDPVRGTYLKYNPLQAAMLRSLDGIRSLDEMVAALSEQFEVEIPRVAAERFVAHARKMMLLEVGCYGPMDDGPARRVVRALRRQGFRFDAVVRDEPWQAAISAETGLLAAAMCHLQAGRPTEAVDYLHAVLELRPDNDRARQLLTAIQTAYIQALSGSTSDFPTFLRFNPTRLLSVLDRTIGRLVFHRLALLPLIALVALAVYCYAITPYAELDVGTVDIVLAVVLTTAHGFLHEIGHALACHHYGGPVPEIGMTLFYYLRPLPYCDTSSSYLFKERKHKVAVQLAGTVVSLVFLCTLFVVLAMIHPGLFIYQAGLLILWISVIMMLLNLVPFVKFDGYYALCDYWGVPNLRERSMKLLKGWLGTHLLGLPATNEAASEALPPTKRRLFFGFALLSTLFTAAWIYWAMFRLLAPIVERFRGVGLVVTLVGLGYLLRGPLFQPVGRLLRLVVRERRRVFTLRRSCVLLGVAVALVVPWMIQIPIWVDADFVLVPAQRVDVRSQTAGRIERILVREGDAVQAGQPLATLRNDDLELEYQVVAAMIEELDARLAELRRGPRREEVQLADRQRGAAEAAQSQHAQRAAITSALAETGLGTALAAASAADSAAVSQSLADAARWRLATLQAGARPEDIAAAEARRARLAAQLDHLRAERELLTIRSPIAGIVATRHLEDQLYAHLGRGDRLAEVHDVSSLAAEIRLPVGAPLDELAAGDGVVLRPVGAPDDELDCAIARLRDAASATDAPEARDSLARQALAPDPGDLLAVTTRFAVGPARVEAKVEARVGMTGHARIHGRRRSLAYAHLYLPLQRVFRVRLWSMM